MLGGLLAALAVVLAWQFWPTVTPRKAPTRTAAAAPGSGPARRAAAAGVAEPPHVDLEALAAPRIAVERAGRNPFRLGAEAPSPTASVPVSPSLAAPQVNAGPPVPPPPPPIPLKYIGTVTAPVPTGRIAVLSDGKFVYYGREGDVIDGRYRVVRIGEESLQIEYVDGRGRQTLRMSGA